MALTLAGCALCIAFILALGTLIDPDPGLPARGVSEIFGDFAFMFGLWCLNVGGFIFVFVGLPWAMLHLIGLRSWWIAPLAGFFVAFCLAFTWTTMMGHPDPRLNTSIGIGADADMIDGHLTPLGESRYGSAAAIANGMVLGLFGAGYGLLLWRIAYRRRQ